jgi:LysM repeat protein
LCGFFVGLGDFGYKVCVVVFEVFDFLCEVVLCGWCGCIEGAKGLVVDVLKARRGTYQKPFLHVGMVFLTVAAVVWGPLIVSQYPMAANAQAVTSSTSPSAVLNNVADISNIDTSTTESVKPRRDVEDYQVKSGDTLSTIAKQFDVDTDSINYLNDFPEERILKPGEIIKIPPVSGVIVKVKSGDTIASLAKKYGIPSPQPIVDWPYNEFANDETFALSAGQTLVIPGGKAPAAAPAPASPTCGSPPTAPSQAAPPGRTPPPERAAPTSSPSPTPPTAAPPKSAPL